MLVAFAGLPAAVAALDAKQLRGDVVARPVPVLSADLKHADAAVVDAVKVKPVVEAERPPHQIGRGVHRLFGMMLTADFQAQDARSSASRRDSVSRMVGKTTVRGAPPHVGDGRIDRGLGHVTANVF